MTPYGTRHHDLWIETPEGRLFVKRWSPAHGEADGAAPLILLHDSPGSVEVWRDFPAALAASIGQPVIAYDRLGFGQSDPHRGQIPLDCAAPGKAGGCSSAGKPLAEALKTDGSSASTKSDQVEESASWHHTHWAITKLHHPCDRGHPPRGVVHGPAGRSWLDGHLPIQEEP